MNDSLDVGQWMDTRTPTTRIAWLISWEDSGTGKETPSLVPIELSRVKWSRSRLNCSCYTGKVFLWLSVSPSILFSMMYHHKTLRKSRVLCMKGPVFLFDWLSISRCFALPFPSTPHDLACRSRFPDTFPSMCCLCVRMCFLPAIYSVFLSFFCFCFWTVLSMSEKKLRLGTHHKNRQKRSQKFLRHIEKPEDGDWKGGGWRRRVFRLRKGLTKRANVFCHERKTLVFRNYLWTSSSSSIGTPTHGLVWQ